MADTTRTIKNATDQELSALLGRVGRERDALRLLKELKVKSIANPNGPFPVYSTTEAFSTETPINNGKTIKDMTDQELGELITRLQNENELARLITDIKDMNDPVIDANGIYSIGKMYEGINLDTPVKDLYHVGILGMRWGVRRASGSGKGSPSDDHALSRDLKKKALKSLSNAELKKLNERLQLEQNYKNLNPNTVKKGASIAKGILAVGTTAASAYALVKSPAGKAVVDAVKTVLMSSKEKWVL